MPRRSVSWRTCCDFRGPRSGFRPRECREPGHLMLPADTRGRGRRAGLIGAAVGVEVLEVCSQNDVEVAWSSGQEVIDDLRTPCLSPRRVCPRRRCELDILGGGRATRQQEQPEQVSEDQVRQSERHGGDRAGRGRSSITAGQRQVQRSGTPYDHVRPPSRSPITADQRVFTFLEPDTPRGRCPRRSASGRDQQAPR